MSDRPSSHESDTIHARLREFTRQERESGTHPAINELRARPKERSAENRKMAEFLRIERGHQV